MPKLTFLEASNGVKLSKEFTTQGKQSYPMSVKNFTSHIYDIKPDAVGWDQQHLLMVKHAQSGHCMLRGELDRPLKNEPRKGHTDRYRKTQTLTLDIDGLELSGYTVPKTISSTDIEDMAERIVKLLPMEFAHATYIATASASLGQKGNRICIHLDFMLASTINPMRLKDWITWLNLNIEALASKISLNASGLSLSYPIDRTVAQNDKLVYCAPPTFTGLTDPVTDRIILVKKLYPSVDIDKLLSVVNVEANSQAILAKVSSLRKEQGLRTRSARTRFVASDDGTRTEVLENPDRARLTKAYHNEEFCYFNLNDGDSNAYWCPIANPRIVYTFKDEPPFEMQRVDPDFYEWYLVEFKDEIRGASNVKPFVFRDFWSDIHYNALFDEATGNIPKIASANKQNLGDFMEEHGLALPEPIPSWDYVFEPQTNKQIDFNRQWLNKYIPTEYSRNVTKIEGLEIGYGDATTLKDHCPTIYTIIWHLVGDSSIEFEHFINWLSFVFNKKDKTGTAWVFSGIEGTGKGLLYHKILAPIIGHSYSVMRKLVDFEDQFNAWQEMNLMTVVDEARISDSASTSKTMNFLKNFITEPYGKIRKMRVDSTQDSKLYNNIIFFTNNNDAMLLSASDRRFNVGMHQNNTLLAAYPQVNKAIDDDLPNELQAFANYLHTFETDERRARTPLDNEAKAAMRVASMTWVDEFCACINTGNLDFLAGFLDMDPASMMEITTFEAAQRFIKSWVADAGVRKSYPSVAELRTVFTCINDKTISAVKFGKLLARHGLKTKQRKLHGRGLEVSWALTEYNRDDLIATHFTPKDIEVYKCNPEITH